MKPPRCVRLPVRCSWAALRNGIPERRTRRNAEGVSAGELERLEGATPLPYLSFARKSLTKEGQEEQANLAAWNALFEENLSRHHPLPHPDDNDLPLPAYVRNAEPPKHGRTAAEVHAERAVPGQPIWSRPPAQHTAAEALASLATCGRDRRNGNAARILARTRGTAAKLERGHRPCATASSTILQGKATTWGRGLSIADGPGVLLDGDGRARFGLSVRGRGRHHRSPPPHADCPGQPCGTAGARPGRHRSARPAHRRRVQRSASLLDGRPRRFGQRDTRPGAGRGVVLQSRRARSFSVAGFHGHGFGQHTR